MKPVHLQDQIYERLLESIRAGEYRPGERLPSMPTLAEKFNVSVSPVRLAILKLDRNGFVSSRHGSGTYVVDPFERFNDRDSVCVCLEHDAHLTSELYLSLTHAFQGMGKFCFGLNPKEPNFPPLLERALNSEAQVFIFFGDQYFPFRLLRPELAKGKTLISVLKAVEPQTTELGASAVLVDIHCGVELAIDHLRRLGHRHLLVVGTNTMIAESFSKYKTDRSELLVNVRGNKDLKFTPLVSRVPESERLCFDEPALLGLLDSPDGPTGILGLRDVAAAALQQLLARRRPDLLARLDMVGFANTPHSKFSTYPFPSVDFNLKEITSQVCRIAAKAFRQRVKPERIYVEPTLALRGG